MGKRYHSGLVPLQELATKYWSINTVVLFLIWEKSIRIRLLVHSLKEVVRKGMRGGKKGFLFFVTLLKGIHLNAFSMNFVIF